VPVGGLLVVQDAEAAFQVVDLGLLVGLLLALQVVGVVVEVHVVQVVLLQLLTLGHGGSLGK